MAMRKLTIKSSELFEPYELTFDSSEFKDSEAFKIAICDCAPGDNYSVSFENLTEVEVDD